MRAALILISAFFALEALTLSEDTNDSPSEIVAVPNDEQPNETFSDTTESELIDESKADETSEMNEKRDVIVPAPEQQVKTTTVVAEPQLGKEDFDTIAALAIKTLLKHKLNKKISEVEAELKGVFDNALHRELVKAKAAMTEVKKKIDEKKKKLTFKVQVPCKVTPKTKPTFKSAKPPVACHPYAYHTQPGTNGHLAVGCMTISCSIERQGTEDQGTYPLPPTAYPQPMNWQNYYPQNWFKKSEKGKQDPNHVSGKTSHVHSNTDYLSDIARKIFEKQKEDISKKAGQASLKSTVATTTAISNVDEANSKDTRNDEQNTVETEKKTKVAAKVANFVESKVKKSKEGSVNAQRPAEGLTHKV